MSNASCGKRAFAASIMMLASSTLAGCASTVMPREVKSQTVMRGERPVTLGSAVRNNFTPMEAPLACLARGLTLARRRPLVIGVGEIKDYTGRYSINEGNVVTQGGALMLYSALAKLGGTVRVAERYDPAIGERELAYTDRRQLGNGEPQQVNGKAVPWLPYYGGSIQGSDYYIVGGITEVNANIMSGGTEVAFNNVGAKRRTYTQSVAIDLRIVDSRSLLVVDAVSLQKQFTGYEVGANTFRFFGLDLFDVNIGTKAQEPMQLGIRATIEEAALLLVGRVNQVDASPCLKLVGARLAPVTSEQYYRAAVAGKVPAIAAASAQAAGIPNGTPAAPANTPRQSAPVAVASAQPPARQPAPTRDLPPVKEQLPARPLAAASAQRPAAPMTVATAQPPARQPAPTQQPQPQPQPIKVTAPAKPPVPSFQPQGIAFALRPAPLAKPSIDVGMPKTARTEPTPLNEIPASGEASGGEVALLTFEVGEVGLSGSAVAMLDRIVTLARKGGVTVTLTTRDNETAFPAQRARMLDSRIAVLLAALANRGIPDAAISVVWRPDNTDSTIYRQGAGLQALARIKIKV